MALQDAELSAPERQLVEAAQSGLECDLGLPGQGDDGAADVVIRAWVLHDLCVEAPHPKGIRLRRGHISGALDFDWETLTAPLVLDQCMLEGPLTLRDASVRSITLADCAVPAVIADRMRSTGAVSVEGSVIDDGISLNAAKLGASLRLDSTRLNGQHAALSARLITVAEDMSLREIRCIGPILLPLASVRGDVIVRDARIRFPRPGSAFNADRAEIGGFL